MLFLIVHVNTASSLIFIIFRASML